MGPLKLGRQLAAARMLAGLDRGQLARAAGLASVTVKKLELLDRVVAHSRTLDALEVALDRVGVEFTCDGAGVGVRLRPVAGKGLSRCRSCR